MRDNLIHELRVDFQRQGQALGNGHDRLGGRLPFLQRPPVQGGGRGLLPGFISPDLRGIAAGDAFLVPTLFSNGLSGLLLSNRDLSARDIVIQPLTRFAGFSEEACSAMLVRLRQLLPGRQWEGIPAPVLAEEMNRRWEVARDADMLVEQATPDACRNGAAGVEPAM